uniref:Membrane transporter protein n=1 Tax=Elaeophora elaphi TaxID=1147741 RepID=A0A0R3RK49_9BILA
MVELSGKSTLQHSFDNSVFIIPGVIVVAIVGQFFFKKKLVFDSLCVFSIALCSVQFNIFFTN